jgi:hypothetical protein
MARSRARPIASPIGLQAPTVGHPPELSSRKGKARAPTRRALLVPVFEQRASVLEPQEQQHGLQNVGERTLLPGSSARSSA